ncbi:(2Fe-2S)-binding protein [Komagataeibacter europaeus]|uniref:(2Fe-2S)-binding protein n=1 Tax=Komagataeibacter europaeus TaxID=33995 RepID=UPI0002FB968E|nr:(2Fe-2S)-binding protein [Komagataeibacter europaeus]GBQ42985.1 aldehyde dehydrogenase [Komagataeibacter europaeus LMG 18890]
MLTLQINGKSVEVDVDPDTPLLWVLRDVLGMTGTKYGCGTAECGVCTVHVDGRPVRSCSLPVGLIGPRKAIITIEGLQADPVAAAVRKAWLDIDVVQCGYCQPGQIMAAIALLKKIPNPTDEQIEAGMSGNLCRCGTYMRIRAAIRNVAAAQGATP